MPRKISSQVARAESDQDVVDDLVWELKEPHDLGQPIILERHMGMADAVHVFVVWDRFADVPESQRASIIMDAYERASGKEFRDRITLATGVTVPEATDLELLPFEVELFPGRHRSADTGRVQWAMVAEGASLLRGEAHPELRFETLADAAAAVERLEESLPGSDWMVVQSVVNQGPSI